MSEITDHQKDVSKVWEETFAKLRICVASMYQSGFKPAPQSKEWKDDWDGMEKWLQAQILILEGIVKNQHDSARLEIPSVMLMLEQVEHCSPTVWPGSVLIDVDFVQVNRLIGILKTIADASIVGDANKAVKDLITRSVWDWVNKALIQSPQKIKDIRSIESAPQELIDVAR